MVPLRSDRVSRAPPYSRMHRYLRLRGYHPLWPAFPNRSAYPQYTTGLFHVRSPLLAESLLMSFPPGTEMFQFPGFASPAYVFSGRYPKGVGCPIRISTDQSLLAAPHGFSQRATSFIASWCQGIHRMPFSYSIQNTVVVRERRTVSLPTMHRNHRRTYPGTIPCKASIMTQHSITNAPDHYRNTGLDDPWQHLRTTTIPSGQTVTQPHDRQSHTVPNQLAPAKTIRVVLRAQERTRTRFTTQKNITAQATRLAANTARPAHPTLSGARHGNADRGSIL